MCQSTIASFSRIARMTQKMPLRPSIASRWCASAREVISWSEPCVLVPCLRAYIASSARRSNSSADNVPSGSSTTPTLAPIA
jgi:hypothetical protein